MAYRRNLPSATTPGLAQHVLTQRPGLSASACPWRRSRMAKKLLVIDRDEKGRFFLSIDGATVTLGTSPAHPEAVLRDLQISRLRCEVEVDGDVSVSPVTGGKVGPRQDLRHGLGVRIGQSRFRVEAAGQQEEEPAAEGLEDAPPILADLAAGGTAGAAAAAPAVLGPLAKQLRVVDGADQGRCFRLPEAGSTPLGKSSKHADIVLHDLYVSRVHCLLDMQGDKVLITHIEGPSGTLINGRRIAQQQELRMGDVLRVGNSHLRLEPASAGGANGKDEAAEDDVEVVEEEAEAVEVVDEGKKADEDDASGLTAEQVEQIARMEGEVLGHYRIGTLLGRG